MNAREFKLIRHCYIINGNISSFSDWKILNGPEPKIGTYEVITVREVINETR
jgi:hypothetical protein